MILRAGTLEELCTSLAGANSGGVMTTGVDLGSMNRVLEHTPKNMTITVEDKITLTALQTHLSLREQ